MGFLDSSVGKESTCNVGNPGSIPGSTRNLKKKKPYITWQKVERLKVERQFKRVFRKVKPEVSVRRTVEPDKCEPDKCEPGGRCEPRKTA